MIDFIGTLAMLALAAADLAVLAGLLWWRGHGRPLPARLEWARTHWATRWLFALRGRPVLVGF